MMKISYYSFAQIKEHYEFLIKIKPDASIHEIYCNVEACCALDEFSEKSEEELFDLFMDLDIDYDDFFIKQKSGTRVNFKSIVSYYFMKKLHQDLPNMKDNIDEDLVKKLINNIPKKHITINEMYSKVLVQLDEQSLS